MKKKYVIALSLLMVILLIYFVPIMLAKGHAKPLFGDFDMGSKCMGGHEIFLLLEKDRCYQSCPGHDDKIDWGVISRGVDSVTIYSADGVTPWARVDYSGTEHFITYTEDGERRSLPQVVSPWRLRLSYYFSGDH